MRAAGLNALCSGSSPNLNPDSDLSPDPNPPTRSSQTLPVRACSRLRFSPSPPQIGAKRRPSIWPSARSFSLGTTANMPLFHSFSYRGRFADADIANNRNGRAEHELLLGGVRHFQVGEGFQLGEALSSRLEASQLRPPKLSPNPNANPNPNPNPKPTQRANNNVLSRQLCLFILFVFN